MALPRTLFAVAVVCVVSSDAAEWTEVTSASSAQRWAAVTSSADGAKLVGLVNSGKPWKSVDSGATWTQSTFTGTYTWYGACSSAGGAIVYITGNEDGDGRVFKSTDSGTSWSLVAGMANKNSRSITCSSDGLKIVILVSGAKPWTVRGCISRAFLCQTLIHGRCLVAE